MEQLIIVFTFKRNIGFTAIPYHATFNDNQPITLHEHVTLAHVNEQPAQFTENEKNIITVLSKISEQGLFKRYSREGTLKQFIDKLATDSRYPTLIKPFIEKQVHAAIKLISCTNLKSFFKNDTFSNIYDSDLLQINPLPAQPVFYFNLTPEGLEYTLKIRQRYPVEQAKEFKLQDKEVDFFCQEPAVLKIGNCLYYFDNIDWNKFKPFLKKETITIPTRQVDIYMNEFVMTCVRSHEVIADGFKIETTTDLPSVHLSIKKSLDHNPALGLFFIYHERLFLADQKAPVFVKLIKNEDGYIFQKISRELTHEKIIEDFLMNLGLSRWGDGLFRPKTNEKIDDPSVQLGLITDWINAHEDKLKEASIKIDSTYDNRDVFIGKVVVEVDSKEVNDWFEINARVIIGEFAIPFMKFRKHLIDNKPEYELPNGQLFIMPREWFTRFSELFHYAKTEQGVIKLPRSHFRLLEVVKHGIHAIEDKPAKEITIPDAKLPGGVVANLRPYQLEGYAWLNFLRENHLGGILADDMGLGKTLQTITLLQKIYENQGAGYSHDEATTSVSTAVQLSLFETGMNSSINSTGIPASLIVMPTSLVHNWQNEFRKFAPTLNVYAYTGSNRLKFNEVSRVFKNYHVILTSYGVLRNDVEALGSYNFQYLILDESQYVKNPSSKIYEAVKCINSNHSLVITGTPIENSLVDLWAQMDLVNKGLLGSLSFFKRHFIQPIAKGGDENLEFKLQKLIKPFILRRTKENVAKDLPPIMEQVLYCNMTPEQEAFYEREKSGIRNTISKIFDAKSNDQTAIIALQALTKLRQIANHPVMVDETYTGSSGKFEQVLDHLESIVSENHNALVFSSFVKDLEIIEVELSKRNLKFEKLVGATRERAKVIENFNNNAQIFLISLKAGGVGLNLTKADYVFMLNPWWNPAAELQAINRAHRIGQTKNVFVYRFLSSGTIEEKIARLKQRKSDLANVFVNSNNPLTDMSREEILELFN